MSEKKSEKCFFQTDYTPPALTGTEFRIIGCQQVTTAAAQTCQVIKTRQALPARFSAS
jgi:hypothetical protein